MELNVEGIIQCIRQGDNTGVLIQLQEFNKEYAQCFFFDVEERDRRKVSRNSHVNANLLKIQRQLEEFKRTKVRDYVESDSDDEYHGDRDFVLRQSLATVLVRFIHAEVDPHLLRVCLCTLRILSRDKKLLGPLVTDSALLTLAKLAGVGVEAGETTEEDNDLSADPYDDILTRLAEAKATYEENYDKAEEDTEDTYSRDDECCTIDDDDAECNVTVSNANSGNQDSNVGQNSPSTGAHNTHRSRPHGVLERGRKDRRQSRKDVETDEEEEEKGEVGQNNQRKEAMKVLCNVVYNSTLAQERFSALRLLSGLTAYLAKSTTLPSIGQFYELRLLFLLTALRPELRTQLLQEGGLSILTAILEQCLDVQWKEQYEVVVDRAAPPITLEASQRAVEVLKVLFNITHSSHRQEPNEEDADRYRHLVAILRLCLMRRCLIEDDTDELQGHTVNLLTALPLPCLDVLLAVPPEPDSHQSLGVNMDCVHVMLSFMERRLDKGDKMKEKLTPVLNLLTESCRAHRETRHYMREHVLPPLRDVSLRPEEGSTTKSRLIRLMTNLDTDLKHCAADLIFVLCKENVSRFVKYTGYGNAAGLLATKGLLGGQGSRSVQYSSDSDSDTEEYRQVKGRINPVTGRVEEEQPDPTEGMTEEEKEEEARRLVALFSKLSSSNILQPMEVNVQGKLVPMTGLRDTSLAEEEGESGAESDGEEEDQG